MRKLTLVIFTASLGLSVQAVAGHNVSGSHIGSGYNVSQEHGVTVYRGEHPENNFRAIAGQAAAAKREKISALKTKVREKNNALRKERQKTADLETRVETLEARQQNKTRRSRYGRSYFGNNRFFGPNGFAGNSNFSGANAIGPVRRARPKRKSRY